MGESEKYCLRWNDFQENISTAFRELRHDADFFDVTIACNSGLDISKTHKVKAHKVILSSCSTFFKDLLKSLNTPVTSQPMLYLRGIKFEDLQAILDFMYYGEVNIAQEKLNSFLAVAEELRVKGLSQSETGQQSSALKDASMFSAKKPKLVKRPAREDGNALSEVKNETSTSSKVPRFSSDGASSSQYPSGFGDDDFEVNERSLDAYSGNEDYADALNESAPDDAGVDSNKELYGGYSFEPEAEVVIEEGEQASNSLDFFSPISAYKDKIRQLIKVDTVSKLAYCSICKQTGSNFETLSNHVEAIHIQKREYICQYCGKAFKTKNHKAVHIHRVHREKHKLAKVFGTTSREII